MGGVVVDGLDLWKCIEMVLFGVDELRGWVGRRVADAHAVLDEPLVDGLGGMGHEDAALEVGLGQDIREGGGMVNVETMPWSATRVIQTVGWAKQEAEAVKAWTEVGNGDKILYFDI